MVTSLVRIWVIAIVSLLPVDQANALSCVNPNIALYASGEAGKTEQDLIRIRSVQFAASFAYDSQDGDVLVFGQFSKALRGPFFHERQHESIWALDPKVSSDVQMPHKVEYSYLGAFSFVGNKVVNGTLVPLTVEVIDAHISFSTQYVDGFYDRLPPTETNVIGVLKPSRGGQTKKLTTSVCPTYFGIDNSQISDLLQCYQDGVCDEFQRN